MHLAFLNRPTKIVNINSASNNVNLYTLSNSPPYPLNLLCFINAAIGSGNTTAAFKLGTGWKPGSYVYVDNNSTITGGTGSTGATGSPGTTG